MLRFSQLVGLLTSTNRRQNSSFGQDLPLLRSVCLQICLPGCLRSLQSRIVDRQSSIDIRGSSNFWRVFVSFTATQSLPCAFHSPIHDFQRHQQPLIGTVVVWKHIFDASSIELSGSTSIAKLTATSDSSFDAHAQHWGKAVATLHCTCTQTFREYFPVGCKMLEFAESATDEEK